nr:AP-4 complex subunit epsilon-1 [Polyrhizophydium stewartii]
MIRRKALLTLHHFYRIDPEAMQPYIKKMKRCLADPHPGVMSAALVALHTVVLAQPSAHGSLAPAVVHILRQILEHRLDVSYNLHGVPAPFEQVNCMRLLALFEPLSAVVEDAITQTLLDALHKVDTNQQDNVAYSALREVWEMLLRLFQSESGIDQHVAIEGIIVLAKQRPDMVRGQEHGLIAAFEEHGDDTVLRHGILTALESMCSDTDAAVALVPLFVAHIRSLVGEGNMALQAQVADGLLAHVQRYPGMDPVAKSKALLDAFAELSDPCRRRLTNTIRVWAADGMLSKEMGVVYALGWLADEALPSHKIWLAVWMCGHWRAVQAVDALTGVLELARQHDATVDPELVAHTIETSMRLCTLPGAAFGFAIVAAVRAFEGSGNIAVANFMEAATANGAFTKPSATF